MINRHLLDGQQEPFNNHLLMITRIPAHSRLSSAMGDPLVDPGDPFLQIFPRPWRLQQPRLENQFAKPGNQGQTRDENPWNLKPDISTSASCAVHSVFVKYGGTWWHMAALVK